MISPTRIAILGATGSIGTQALDVVRDLHQAGHPIRVVALAAGRNVEALAARVVEFGARCAGVAGPAEADRLQRLVPPTTEVVYGSEGLAYLSSLSDVDLVLNAVVGAAGLVPTLSALGAGKRLALANKESLVIGGTLVMQARRRPDQIIPVDSEHAALFQILGGDTSREVERAWITASGGPFRSRPLAELSTVTPAEALAHPVWPMGRRISVDSATLANKAFEVIEAHHLFSLPWERIGVLIHPRAQVHALVEFVDGTMLAQLAPPDMRIPIQSAITYPTRLPTRTHRIALPELEVSFDVLVPAQNPAFGAILEAGMTGGTAPAVANAADEVLVEAFLCGEIPFTAIAEGITSVLCDHRSIRVQDLGDVLSADKWARERAREVVARRTRSV